jgi:hypothetical protein
MCNTLLLLTRPSVLIHVGLSLNIKRLGATSVAQLGVASLNKGSAIAGEPRLDLSHACSPECINTDGLASNPKEL